MHRVSRSFVRLMLGGAIVATLPGCRGGSNDSGASGTPANSEATQSSARPKSVTETSARMPKEVQPGSNCNVERVDGQPFVPAKSSLSAGNTLHVSGWIIDEVNKSAPSEVKIRMQSSDGVSAWEQKVIEGVDRPDVVQGFGNQAGFLKSGFTVDLDLSGVSPGHYVLYLAFPGNHGERICGGWGFALSE